jgi:hypothetical protein
MIRARLARSPLLAALALAFAGCGSTPAEPGADAGDDGSGGGNRRGPVDGRVDALPAPQGCSGTCVITFASSPEWTVYDDDPASNPTARALGTAQPVCLSATSPPNCPAGAVVYGAGDGWPASLSLIPGALWVWGPGASATSPADLTRFAFVHRFEIGTPIAGTLSIAADDAAEVIVNGTLAGTTGSITDATTAGMASQALKGFNLLPLLVVGENTITVLGQNGPASFAMGCATGCTYAMNPGGVVFGGTLAYH